MPARLFFLEERNVGQCSSLHQGPASPVDHTPVGLSLFLLTLDILGLLVLPLGLEQQLLFLGCQYGLQLLLCLVHLEKTVHRDPGVPTVPNNPPWGGLRPQALCPPALTSPKLWKSTFPSPTPS